MTLGGLLMLELHANSLDSPPMVRKIACVAMHSMCYSHVSFHNKTCVCIYFTCVSVHFIRLCISRDLCLYAFYMLVCEIHMKFLVCDSMC